MKVWRTAVFLAIMLVSVFLPPTANAQVGTNQDAPAWRQIENSGEPMDFKILWGPSAQTGTDCQQGFNCEWLNSTADVAGDTQRVRIPMTYYAFTGPSSPGAETRFGGCDYTQLNSDPNVPVNYYDAGTNTKLTDANPIFPNPSMFNVSQPYANAKGFVTLGYTSGTTSSSIPFAVATAYVSSNRCSAADTEWGFYKHLTPDQQFRFYYSLYTNCAFPASNSLCRIAPYGAANQVAQLNGSLVVDISNITTVNQTTNYYYSMYIIPANLSTYPSPQGSNYAFRIQVLDQNTALANCNLSWKDTSTGLEVQGMTGAPCTADFPIDSWFPISMMTNAFSQPAYLVTGTQMVGPANYVGPTWQVNGVWLGF